MRLHARSGAAFLAAVAVGYSCAWAEQAGASITVEVRDFAGVPAATLAAGMDVAQSVLHKAGIELRWSPSPGGAGAGARADTAGAASLQLRILGPQHAAPVRSHSALGFAILPEDGRPATSAGVRFGAVERQRHETSASLPQILGYVVAHELGHLLLGTNNHTQWGVMSAQVSGRYFDRAAQGTLSFAADEATRLRAAVRRRGAGARPLALD